MREFIVPFKPEELQAQPSDDRLWASNVPDVENWSSDETDEALNSMTRRVLKTQGRDVADDKSFSILFGLVQAWPHLEEAVTARVAELLTDALHRLVADAARLKKADKAAAAAKPKEKEAHLEELREVRTSAKVVIFFLRLAIEKALKEASKEKPRRRGKAANRNGDDEKAKEEEEAKERHKALERQRCSLLSAVVDGLSKSAMPWLWQGDTVAWQQAAEKVSDCGFVVLDFEVALKHKETRNIGLRCIVEPLQQEGHDHSNLLLAVVSKLTHGLRGHELAAPFVADAVAMGHDTSLPRSLLVELMQICMSSSLASQGAFQRSIGCFLSSLAERLPHVVLGNISVLLELLNVDCYPLRSAIVDSIGSLLCAEGRPLPKGARCLETKAEGTENGEGLGNGTDDLGHGTFRFAPETKSELLETLLSRSLDKTVWVRVQTLRTITNLAQSKKGLQKEAWPRVLQIAIKRMQDSASSARKATLGLVKVLIQHHPFGPSLKGTGDERAKTEQILRYIHDRRQALTAEAAAEEIAEAEAVLEKNRASEEDDDTMEADLPTSQEVAVKRRRLGKKTNAHDTNPEYEIDKALAAEAEEGESRFDQRNRELKKLEEMEQCYTDRFKFVELLEMAEPRLRNLLISRNCWDVTEAIGVVVELKRRGLPAAARAFNQILSLVWSKHANVKDAAVEAFFTMHLEDKSVEQAVQSLLEMYQDGASTGGWTYTHLSSVSELIQQAAAQERINPAGAIRVLVRELQGTACPMALRTLTALGAADANTLTKTLPQIVEFFGPQGTSFGTDPSERLDRVRLLCQLLQRLQTCVKPPLSPNSTEFGHVWALCQQATRVVLEQFSKGTVAAEWFGAAQAVMDLSFDLAAVATEDSPAGVGCPDKQWEAILEAMLRGVLQQIKNRPSETVVESTADEERCEDDEMGKQIVVASNTAGDAKAHASQLSCTVFLLGHFALRMVVYMESTQALLKKKRTAEEDSRLAAERDKKKENKPAKKSKKGGKDAKEGENKEDDEAEAAGMGMAGQEEREAEHFAEMIEQRLLYNSKSILSRARPLLLKGLCDPQQRSNPIVRRAAAISLCKYMAVSKRFCEEYLQLLFSVLFPKSRDQNGLLASSGVDVESTAQDSATASSGSELLEDITLRQSLLVAVGDLLFRHPNVVEPWTDRLYNALGTPSGGSADSIARATDLRLTALLVLTHLVLNDMMKPRAVLLGRALWLTACKHESTARVARILYQELSKRSNNVIYNLLPEIIARLPEQKEDNANSTNSSAEERVAWVMQFIEKEKHIEGLIEKLSIRLEQASDIKGMSKEGFANAADGTEEDDVAEHTLPSIAPSGALESVSCLAHAIGGMNYSDRCILRLHDVMVTRKALNTAISYHQVVRDCILGIVEKARRPRAGKVGGEGAPEPEGADAVASSKGGKVDKDSAAAKAIDEIEKLVNTLGAKKKSETEADDQPQIEIPTPQPGGRAVIPAEDPKKDASNEEPKKGKGNKRKQTDLDDDAANQEDVPRTKSKRGKATSSAAPQPPAPSEDLFAGARQAATAPAPAPPVKKVVSGGEAFRAALQEQKAARKAKGKGKGKAAARTKVDDDEV